MNYAGLASPGLRARGLDCVLSPKTRPTWALVYVVKALACSRAWAWARPGRRFYEFGLKTFWVNFCPQIFKFGIFPPQKQQI
jgi:hypothetical protein